MLKGKGDDQPSSCLCSFMSLFPQFQEMMMMSLFHLLSDTLLFIGIASTISCGLSLTGTVKMRVIQQAYDNGGGNVSGGNDKR